MSLSQGTVARFTVWQGCVLHNARSMPFRTASILAESARGTASFDPPRQTRRQGNGACGVSPGRKIGPPPRWRDAGGEGDGTGRADPSRHHSATALHYRLKAATARPVLFWRKWPGISQGESAPPPWRADQTKVTDAGDTERGGYREESPPEFAARSLLPLHVLSLFPPATCPFLFPSAARSGLRTHAP